MAFRVDNPKKNNFWFLGLYFLLFQFLVSFLSFHVGKYVQKEEDVDRIQEYSQQRIYYRSQYDDLYKEYAQCQVLKNHYRTSLILANRTMIFGGGCTQAVGVGDTFSSDTMSDGYDYFSLGKDVLFDP